MFVYFWIEVHVKELYLNRKQETKSEFVVINILILVDLRHKSVYSKFILK